ncbi:hypothetical protein S245_063164, partial [Arachis hypogaea]
ILSFRGIILSLLYYPQTRLTRRHAKRKESKTVDLVEPLPGGQRTKRFMRGLLNLMILSKKGTRTCSSETRRGIGY